MGDLHGVPVREPVIDHGCGPANAPRAHDFAPTTFYRVISGAGPPALRVFPGDTVRAQTIDAGGVIDKNDKPRQMPCISISPARSPEKARCQATRSLFSFNGVRPNRKWASQQRAVIHAAALLQGAPQSFEKDWSDRWTLDLEKGTATPDAPGERLKNVSIGLEPMLGVVGVAPFWDQVSTPPDLGRWGGNLDYNQLSEDVTIYFTVYQAGAHLFHGQRPRAAGRWRDHRAGTGNLNGRRIHCQSIIKGPYLDQPWLENSEYVMVCGIEKLLRSRDAGRQRASSKWLAQPLQT